MSQFNQPSERISDIIRHANSRKHNDLDMVFKVYENNELMCIFDEDAPTHWVIIVDSSRVMQDRSLNVDPNLCQPLLLLVFYA